MEHKRFTPLILLVLLLLACNLTSKPSLSSLPWQDTVDEMRALTQGLEIPEHLTDEDAVKIGGEFDVNEYFSVLTHLSMEPGYTLDYVYYYDGFGGGPLIYAKPEHQPPYQTYSEYADAVGEVSTWESSKKYLEHIQIDDSAEGFFEFVLLDIMGDQFYLFWHSNYHDAQVVCDNVTVEGILQSIEEADFGDAFSGSEKRKALALDLEPVIEFKEDSVQVRVVIFTKWGGFIEQVYTIRRDFPHTILDRQKDVLLPYDCGIMF